MYKSIEKRKTIPRAFSSKTNLHRHQCIYFNDNRKFIQMQPADNQTQPFKKKSTKIKFTLKDDRMLIDLHHQYRDNWNFIATKFPNRTARQLRDRFKNYLSKSNALWSQEEDNRLLEKVVDIGQKWSKLTVFFSNRNSDELKNRYHILQQRTTAHSIRSRKIRQTTYTFSLSGYKSHYMYKNVLTKQSGTTQFLFWTNPKKQIEIITDGNRTNDLKQVPQAAYGYVWHHCELTDVSGTCIMQEVPAYEHEDISHIGAISQFKNDKM